jgi:hypothetical protein
MTDHWPTIAPTFRDEEREDEYRRQGIVTVGPVLDAAQVEQLRALADATAPAGEDGIVIDYRRDDRTRMHALRAAIGPLLEERLAELFTDHRLVLASFIAKYPGGDSAMVMHEDRTHVDERRFRAGNLWIPLDAVGADRGNGGIQVVPRSHLLTDGLVGTRTPDLWRPYEAFLRRHLVMPDLAAGAAVYYDNRTLHASPSNLSSATRLAIACLITPRAAALRHVVATGRRHRVVFEVDDPFFLEVPPHTIDLDLMQAYPVAEEVDEDVVLEPARVASIIGADTTDPGDAPLSPPPAPEGVTRGPRRLPGCRADPPPPPADPDAPVTHWTVGPLQLTRYEGQAACAVVAGPGPRPAAVPSWAAAFVPPAGTTDDAAVVLLGEDALVEIGPTEDRRPWTVDVIDVPIGAAHLRVDTGDEVLDDRVSLTLTRTKATVWNHGPGNAALLVRAPTPADHVDDPPVTTRTKFDAGAATRWVRHRWSARPRSARPRSARR